MDQAALPAKLSEGQPAALAGRSRLTRPPWSAVLGAAMLSFRRNRPRSLPGCRELWGQDRLRGALDGQGAAGLVPFARTAHRFGRTPGARSGVSRNVTHPGPGTPQRAPRGLRPLPKPWRLPLGRERALQGSQCPASPARHSAPCIPDAEWARGPPSLFTILGVWTRPSIPIPSGLSPASSLLAVPPARGGQREVPLLFRVLETRGARGLLGSG